MLQDLVSYLRQHSAKRIGLRHIQQYNRHQNNLSVSLQLILTVGSVVLCLPFAVLLSLMAESPIVGLEKLLLRPSKTSVFS